MKTLRIAAAPLILGLALTACSSGEDVTPASSATPTTTSGTTTSATESATESETGTATESTTGTETPSSSASGSSSSSSAAGEDLTKTFGETVTWSNGFSMTVAKPEKFTPSMSSVGGDKAKYAVKITFTAKNGSKEPYKPMLLPTGQSANKEMGMVFDSGNGCGSGPDSTILPGKTLVFTQCYAADDLDDMTVSLSPGSDYEEAFWSTS